MGKRRVVRRSNTKKLTEEEKARIMQQQEERGKAALGRARASIKLTTEATAQSERVEQPTTKGQQALEIKIATCASHNSETSLTIHEHTKYKVI